MKNKIRRCWDRCHQKPGSFNIAKVLILILISLLFCDETTSREFFSHADKDSSFRLITLSFKCYTCYFKGSYSSKTVYCYGATLRRKGLSSFVLRRVVIKNAWSLIAKTNPERRALVQKIRKSIQKVNAVTKVSKMWAIKNR